MNQYDNSKSIAIFIGPYRNLTTLTAGVFSLHPHCQVLNHAAERILNNERIDFISNPLDQTISNFWEFAIEASRSGQRGPHGGSILYSHVYDEAMFQVSYQNKYGSEMTKQKIICLLWKDSLRLSFHLQKNDTQLNKLLTNHKNIKFIMPIRNPLDCASSNYHNGYWKDYPGLTEQPSIEKMLEVILLELSYGFKLKQRYNEQVYIFFEHEICKKLISEVAYFCRLDSDPKWLNEVEKLFVTKDKNYITKNLENFFKQKIALIFKDEIIKNKFLKFLN